jgi:SDR family mycofactocin-dependent oxidoreductase
MGSLAGKVAFISGAGRGQGRSHAVRLAQEGVDIIAFDVCAHEPGVDYPLATREDLDETVALVEKLDRRIIARQADVRDGDAVQAVFDEGISELGRVDIVLANAGIMCITGPERDSPAAFQLAVDVNLTGAMNTIEAAVPTMIAQRGGGSIVITSSSGGLKGSLRDRKMTSRGLLGCIASKHGEVGLMRAYANSLGADGIRVNTVHPTGVNTPMGASEALTRFAEENPTFVEALQNVLPVPILEPTDITDAVVWLCSDAARYITGVALPVDAGCTVR